MSCERRLRGGNTPYRDAEVLPIRLPEGMQNHDSSEMSSIAAGREHIRLQQLGGLLHVGE